MNRKITSLALILLASCLFSSNSFAHGFDTPEQAVNTYIKAVTTGSAEHVEMAFTPSASIQFYNHNGELKQFTRDVFSKLVGTGQTWNAKIEITQMKVTGNVANATVEFTWGENNQHGYVDYLNLINDGKSWHISDKVAQYISK